VDVEEYSYDAKNDIHSFNPVHNGVIEEVVDGSVKSTLVVKTENGIRTVPIYTPPEEFENTCELCDAETQTDELEMHGLAELSEVAELLEDMSTGTPGISSITESRVVLPLLMRQGRPKLRWSFRKSSRS
jgi:hypothetical protein